MIWPDTHSIPKGQSTKVGLVPVMFGEVFFKYSNYLHCAHAKHGGHETPHQTHDWHRSLC